METDYTIAHHQVPMHIFERLIEVKPEGTYRALTKTTVAFTVTKESFQEHWFLHRDDCTDWYKQNNTEPSVKTEGEE